MRAGIWTLLAALVLAAPAPAQTWRSVLEQATGAGREPAKASGGVTEAEASEGLKAALELGAQKAVELASARDGFWGNGAIRIPLPGSVRSAGEALRRFGMGQVVDRFEESMNRAAETATARAKPILLEAVRGLTMEDALAILRGGDTAATDLLRARTEDGLAREFRPVVARAMEETEVTRYHDQLLAQGRSLFAALGQEPEELDEYVTRKTLDGLFALIAEEEKKIRTDPVARTTDLLRRVFAGSAK